MSVDIQEVTAEVDDILDRDARQAPKRAGGEDPGAKAQQFRLMRARAHWAEARLEP